MEYLPILGKKLKSDELLDLLETHDVEVIYDYDRLHENTPDQYWASILDLGMQLKFDEHQVLRTIFLFLTQENEFEPADIGSSDIHVFGSKQEVRDFSLVNGIATVEGVSEFFGTRNDWIKLDCSGHTVHYDFGGGSLKQVTLDLTLIE